MKRTGAVPDRPAWRPLAVATALLVPAIAVLAPETQDSVTLLLWAVAAFCYLIALTSVARSALFWGTRRDYAAATARFAAAVGRLRPAPSMYEDPDTAVIVVRTRRRRRWAPGSVEILWKFDRGDLLRAQDDPAEPARSEPIVAVRYGFNRYGPVWSRTEVLTLAVDENGTMTAADLSPVGASARRHADFYGMRTGALYAGTCELDDMTRIIRNSRPVAPPPDPT